MRKSTDSGVKWAACSLIIGMGCRVQVFAWSSIAQSVCQRAFSLLVIWCLGPRVQILHSAEEHNLSPFDLNIACLCQSIEVNNNKYVYRQIQARKSTDSGAKWAECSLTIGTGCRVQVFAWSSIAQSVCQRAFSLLAIWCLAPRVQILHSAEENNLSPFYLNIACLCQSIDINNNKYVCMYECMYVCIYIFWNILLSQFNSTSNLVMTSILNSDKGIISPQFYGCMYFVKCMPHETTRNKIRDHSTTIRTYPDSRKCCSCFQLLLRTRI